MKKYELIIFDMDGVLIDSEMHYIQEIMAFLNETYQGHSINEKDLYVLVGKSWDEHYQILTSLIEKTHSVDNIRKEFNEYENGLERNYREWLFDDINTTLIMLKNEGYTLALASNSSQELIDHVLTSTNIDHYFELVISGDAFKMGKPSPEIYEYIGRQLQVIPKYTLIIEDSFSGITAGKEAECSVVAIYDSHFSMDQNRADYIIQDLYQLFELL